MTMRCNNNLLSRKTKFFVFICLLFCAAVFAQPSGGPYGPILKTYELPKDVEHIYYVAPDGSDAASGQTPEAATTLSAALERVVTGDAIIMRGGIYRIGGLKFNQGITIQPYKDEQPILKGTQVAKDWEPFGEGLWKTVWGTLFPSRPAGWWSRKSNVAKTPLHRFNNDMVFVDGRFLQSAGWEGEVNENTFYIDYDAGEVYIGVDPTDKLIEITAFDSALIRTNKSCHGKAPDKKGAVVRGITFTQYAYRALEVEGPRPQGPADASSFGKDVVGSVFENCTITFCSRVAGYFQGDRFTMRHCLVSDTSTEGVYVIASADILLEKNIFRRNNIENITGYFPAAVKIFNQCHRATCRDNLVIDHPNSNGIWYDVGEVDGVFVDNWLQDIGQTHTAMNHQRFWPSRNAFFFEISKGATVAGNVFINCDHSMFVLNSCDVRMYQNTCINSTVCIERTERSAANDHFGWHPAAGPDVDEREGHVFMNNLMVGDETFTRALLALSQPTDLCGQLNKPQLRQIDYNMYVRQGDTTNPLIYWSPVQNEDCQEGLGSPEQLHKMYPEFAKNSRVFASYAGPLFKSAALAKYELLEAFPAARTAATLPDDVRAVLGATEGTAPHPGAYPSVPAK